MFGYVKEILVSTMMFFGCNISNVNALKCISINNQECGIRPEIMNININEPTYYPYSVKKSKCRGSCNNMINPSAKLCVPDVVKNINLELFNLMSRTNTARYIKYLKTCKCKCRLNASVCDNKQR